MTSLKRQSGLITGGTSGIGRAAAAAFARAGARIFLAGRRVELGEEVARQLRSEGAEVRFVQADVSLARDVEPLVSSTVQAYGRLDAAFNNAATTDRALAMNLKSVWLCLQSEIRQMLSQDPPGGAIVNTSSVNGLGGTAGGALYSVAKAGVLALTKSAGESPDGPEAVEAQYTALIPMRRIGRPEEAAEAVVWLCSDAASYVTGHSMIVDGGMTAGTR